MCRMEAEGRYRQSFCYCRVHGTILSQTLPRQLHNTSLEEGTFPTKHEDVIRNAITGSSNNISGESIEDLTKKSKDKRRKKLCDQNTRPISQYTQDISMYASLYQNAAQDAQTTKHSTIIIMRAYYQMIFLKNTHKFIQMFLKPSPTIIAVQKGTMMRLLLKIL